MPVKKQGGYALFLRASSSTPADATAYYFGSQTINWSTVANHGRVYIPKAGVIKTVQIYLEVGGSGTAEDTVFELLLNNTTLYPIATAAHLNVSSVLVATYTLNIPVVVGDYFEIKVTCPTWVTNPTAVTTAGNVLVVY